MDISILNNKCIGVNNPDELKHKLNQTKNKLDNINKYKYYKNNYQLDPFRKYKHDLEIKLNIKGISNAWLKCYEIIHKYRFSFFKSNSTINVFCNAEFPGSFVKCIDYYITKKLKKELKWVASSLIDPSSTALNDTYGLYKTNKNNWLMNEKNNGDLTDVHTIEYIEEYFNKNGHVDLYTSDLGMDASSDYNNQEQQHIKANIGQILSGLVSLKQFGCMFFKMFTFFESINIYVLESLKSAFEHVYISKPMSSRKGNSEIYVVCINYTKNKELIKILYKLFSSKCRELYMNNIYTCTNLFDIREKMIDSQINFINKSVDCYNKKQLDYKYINDSISLMEKLL